MRTISNGITRVAIISGGTGSAIGIVFALVATATGGSNALAAAVTDLVG